MISEKLYKNYKIKHWNTEIWIFSDFFHTLVRHVHMSARVYHRGQHFTAVHRNTTDATLKVHLRTGGRLVCPERPTLILVAA